MQFNHIINQDKQPVPILSSPKELTYRAYDEIISVIGSENIVTFLPLWESNGVFKDLLKQHITFTGSNFTYNRVDGVLHEVPQFNGGTSKITQVPETQATVDNANQTLVAPTHIATQTLGGLSAEVGFIRLKLKRVGNPTGNVHLEIRNAKDGTAVTNGVSQSLAVTNIETSAVYKGFVFSQAPKLQKNVTYYIALVYEDGAIIDGSNHIAWHYDSTGSYGKGSAIYNGGWMEYSGRDFAFDLYANDIVLDGDFTMIALAQLDDKVSLATRNVISGTGMTDVGVVGLQYSAIGTIAARANDLSSARAAHWYRHPSTWQALAYTYDADAIAEKVKLFSNGYKVAVADGVSGTVGNPTKRLAQPLTIGSLTTTSGLISEVFAGKISSVIIVKRALSVQEIGQVSQILLSQRKRMGAL